jgi:hypothetical protein
MANDTGGPKAAAIKVKLLEDATLAGLEAAISSFLLGLTGEEQIFGPVVVVDVAGKYVATINYTE